MLWQISSAKQNYRLASGSITCLVTALNVIKYWMMRDWQGMRHEGHTYRHRGVPLPEICSHVDRCSGSCLWYSHRSDCIGTGEFHLGIHRCLQQATEDEDVKMKPLRLQFFLKFVLKRMFSALSRYTVDTHLRRSHWRLWSYHWGTGQCRCNHPVCFYTADLNGKPSACTRLYLRWWEREQVKCRTDLTRAFDCVVSSNAIKLKKRALFGEVKQPHLYSVGSWAESPARRHIGNFQSCSDSVDCMDWTLGTRLHLTNKEGNCQSVHQSSKLYL